MLLAIGQLWTVIIASIIAYALVITAVVAIIVMSISARNQIQSGIDAPNDGDTSSDDSRKNLKRTAEYAAIIGGVAIVFGSVSLLIAIGFFAGA